MFNKKFLVVLCNVIGVICALTFLLHLTMYIWALFGTAPLEIYDVKKGLVSYYSLINQLASFTFYFILAGTAATLVKAAKTEK